MRHQHESPKLDSCANSGDHSDLIQPITYPLHYPLKVASHFVLN